MQSQGVLILGMPSSKGVAQRKVQAELFSCVCWESQELYQQLNKFTYVYIYTKTECQHFLLFTSI